MSDAIKKTDKKCLLMALVLTLISSAIGFGVSGHFPIGKYIFMEGDCLIQSVPLTKLFWERLLNGNMTGYSLALSMGQPVNAVFSIMSPIPAGIWTIVFDDPDIAAYMIFLTKQLLAAMTFFVFATRALGAKGDSAAICAASYANCGYVINFYSHLNLLDGLYFLPLIVLCIFELIREKKWHGLCISYAALFCVNYYEGYIVGLFTFVIFVVLLFVEKKENGAKPLQVILLFVLSSGLAVAISAFVTLPAIGFMLSNRGTDVTQFVNAGGHLWDVVANLFIGQAYGMNAAVPMIFSGVYSLFLLVVFLGGKTVSAKKKVLFLAPLFVWLLCVFFDGAYMVINAFDMPDGNLFRFSFVFSFLLCSMCAWGIGREEIVISKKLVIVISMAALVFYAVVMLVQDHLPVTGGRKSMSIAGLIVNGIFLAAYAGVFFTMKDMGSKKTVMIISTLVVLENSVNIYMILEPENVTYERRRDYYELYTDENKKAMEAIEKAENGDGREVYRVRSENVLGPNNTALWGYYGVGYFSTFEQPKVREFMSKLGYYSEGAGCLNDYGGSILTQSLFAQKYSFHICDPRIENEDSFTVELNPLALPLAYYVSEDIKTYQANAEDPFANQERLLSCMLGDDTHVFVSLSDNAEIQEQNVKRYHEDNAIIWELDNSANGWGTVLFHFVPEGEQAYVFFKAGEEGIAGKAPRLATNKDGGIPRMLSDLYTPHIMEMSLGETGTFDAGLIIDDPEHARAVISDIYAYSVDKKAYEEAVCRLKEGGINLVYGDNGELTATVTSRIGRVFTSIPYDEGWKVYMDGKEMSTEPVCEGAFLSFVLPEGGKELKLVYRDKWLAWGIQISIFGGLLLIVVSVLEKKTYSLHNDKGSI